MLILRVGAETFHADGGKKMTLIVVFCISENVPKKILALRSERENSEQNSSSCGIFPNFPRVVDVLLSPQVPVHDADSCKAHWIPRI